MIFVFKKGELKFNSLHSLGFSPLRFELTTSALHNQGLSSCTIQHEYVATINLTSISFQSNHCNPCKIHEMDQVNQLRVLTSTLNLIYGFRQCGETYSIIVVPYVLTWLGFESATFGITRVYFEQTMPWKKSTLTATSPTAMFAFVVSNIVDAFTM